MQNKIYREKETGREYFKADVTFKTKGISNNPLTRYVFYTEDGKHIFSKLVDDFNENFVEIND